MIKRLHLFVSTMFMMFVVSVVYAQDPEFTQFYANPIYLNPAFAGTANCPRLTMNYRNQWPAISGTYVTYSASYDQHIDKIAGGIGFIVMADKAGQGVLNTTSGALMYSYRLTINRKFSIKAGLQAGYFQRTINWSSLTFPDMIDPKYGFVMNTGEKQPKTSKGAPDFAAGILGFSENFYFGVAAHHLTQPDEGFISFSRLPMKLTVHAGGVIHFDNGRKRRRKITDPSISPNVLFMKQQDFNQFNYGFYFNKYPFVLGVWYRQCFNNSDAFIAMAGFQQKSFKFGYSYDVTVSKLSNATAGAHELSFTLQFPCRPKKKKLRAISCPSF